MSYWKGCCSLRGLADDDCWAGLDVRIMVATGGKERLVGEGAVFIDNGSTQK